MLGIFSAKNYRLSSVVTGISGSILFLEKVLYGQQVLMSVSVYTDLRLVRTCRTLFVFISISFSGQSIRQTARWLRAVVVNAITILFGERPSLALIVPFVSFGKTHIASNQLTSSPGSYTVFISKKYWSLSWFWKTETSFSSVGTYK